MGRRKLNFVGRTFGRLTVIAEAPSIGPYSASLCRCLCGKDKVVANHNLKRGTTQSCGCYAKEKWAESLRERKPQRKHGASKTITYSSWSAMYNRCLNKSYQNYKRYGGRGITLCDRWSDPDFGYTNFVSDMGERPSKAYSIDRIDSTKGYELGNCRWATKIQQGRNSLSKGALSGFKGVTFKEKMKSKPWRAIIHSVKDYSLGYYETKEEAALAYNVASVRLHGEFGVRNSLPQMNSEVTKRVTEIVNKILDEKECE